MLEGALDVGWHIILVPDLIELSYEKEEGDEQDDRGPKDEAGGPSHCCMGGISMRFIERVDVRQTFGFAVCTLLSIVLGKSWGVGGWRMDGFTRRDGLLKPDH